VDSLAIADCGLRIADSKTGTHLLAQTAIRKPQSAIEGIRNREEEPDARAAFAPRWLSPRNTRLQLGDHNTLQAAVGDELYDGVFAVRALPATCPGQFVSLRYADAEGQEHEVGMVRDLTDWPAEDRILLEQALLRRYFVRVITDIASIELKYGLLTFRVDTDRGPTTFTMRNSHGQAQDYGRTGKLLIDVDENRYLLRDIDALPRRQQLLFRRYIYW
jgi:hypothetical protein